MIAMYKNKIINVKARYETLCSIKKNQEVKMNEKQYQLNE